MSAIDLVTEFIDKKRQTLSEDTDSLTTLSKQSPAQQISDLTTEDIGDKIWDNIKESPLAQMGKDFVSEQVAKNGTKLINNVDAAVRKKANEVISKAIAPVEQLQNLVFDSITAILTAKNDLAMYFIQQMAKQILIVIDQKRDVSIQLQEKIRELHNILALLTTTNPFFDDYLAQLRRGLALIYDARQDLTVVRNTLQANDRWLKTRFKQSKEKLLQAEELMSPGGSDPDVKFTDKGLLSGVGVPAKPQQLMLLLSLPQKIKEVLACANGYFILVVKLNALLVAFNAAYGSFTESSSRKLKQFTISTLDNIVSSMDELISDMATNLNGSPNSILQPDTVIGASIDPSIIAAAQGGENIGMTDPSTFLSSSTRKPFSPDPLLTSANAMGWLFEIKTIIAYYDLIPGPTLEALDVSNNALTLYNEAVKTIKSKNNRVDGDAILTATEGREEVGQLEKQITRYVLSAGQALTNIQTARAVLPLGRTLIKRIDLSLTQDKEIRDAVAKFANAELAFPSAITRAGQGVFAMLDKFGLDRAMDALRSGDFAKFFSMDGKTATYAGAAIAAFSALKECLSTEEDREQLTQAQREFEREQKSKELIASRSASTGFQMQIQEVTKEDIRLDTLNERTKVAGKKCGLADDFSPTNLMKNLGPIVGVSVLGNKSLQDKLTKISRGIF